MRLASDIKFDEIDAAVAAKREHAADAKKAKSSSAKKRSAAGTEPVRTDADYLIYEMKFDRLEWFADVSRLSFLKKHLPDEAVAIWSGLFRRYLDYRTGMRGFEATDPVGNALRVLADYLRVCIPVSYHQSAFDGPLPSCPREFTRFPFIDDRGQGEGHTPTFLEYVGERFSNESGYAHINHVRLFFEYIEANYRDEASSDIAGPGFTNPIVQAFDLPRVRGAKARRTNKKPFGKSVVPHLLHWLYAIESFGTYLQNSSEEVHARDTIICTADLGFLPHYEHMGTEYEVREFPARLIRPAQGYKRPSLTVLRMIIACLEIGLRMQGLQWLCRRRFDSRNTEGDQRDFFVLGRVDRFNQHQPARKTDDG